MTTTISTVDLKTIHEIYKFIEAEYPDHNERLLFFLATCLHLDPDVNLENALELRPNGGVVEIDNYPMDGYLKPIKMLQLNGILHDAPGFIAVYNQKCQGYF